MHCSIFWRCTARLRSGGDLGPRSKSGAGNARLKAITHHVRPRQTGLAQAQPPHSRQQGPASKHPMRSLAHRPAAPAAQAARSGHCRSALRVRASTAQTVEAQSAAGPGPRALMTGCRLIGVGSCVPDTVLTNDDLSAWVDTNDEWISSRTGIRRRHVLGKGETLSDLAAKAANRALEMAGVKAEEIDLVLFATSSPDDAFGSACQVRGSASGGPRTRRFASRCQDGHPGWGGEARPPQRERAGGWRRPRTRMPSCGITASRLGVAALQPVRVGGGGRAGGRPARNGRNSHQPLRARCTCHTCVARAPVLFRGLMVRVWVCLCVGV